MKSHFTVLASCCIFIGCSSTTEDIPTNQSDSTANSEASTEYSDLINYETFQGSWKIVEIHTNNIELGTLESLVTNEGSSVYANLNFYRPTLGDPARLDMNWICNGLGFSYVYENNLIRRLGDVGVPDSPSPNVDVKKYQNYDIQPRISCLSPPPDEQQEAARIAALMSMLTQRFMLFETYQTEFQMNGNVVSIFTSQGDGIYAARM